MYYYNLCKIYNKWLPDYEEYIFKTLDPQEADILINDITKIDLNKYLANYIVCPCTNTNHIEHKEGRNIISLEGETEFLNTITSTAEHTMRLMLDICRPIGHTINFHGRPKNPGNILRGKTLGIIGYGRIGKQVARLAEAFGMNIIVYDIRIVRGPIKERLHTLLKNSDIITIHASIKKNQLPILGIKELTMVKQGSYLINTSRGEAICERALSTMSYKFNGIALDVIRNDDFANTELRSIPNCIITNHIGGYTIEDLENTFRFCMDKLMRRLGVIL